MTTAPSDDTCDPGCGLNTTLRIISGKWKPLVLFFLRDGPKRYGELKRLIPGVSHKVLIQQLKDSRGPTTRRCRRGWTTR